MSDKGADLASLAPVDSRPPILLAQLDPPGLCIGEWRSATEYECTGFLFEPDYRWKVMSALWMVLGAEAQRLLFAELDWGAYASE